MFCEYNRRFFVVFYSRTVGVYDASQNALPKGHASQIGKRWTVQVTCSGAIESVQSAIIAYRCQDRNYLESCAEITLLLQSRRV